MKRAASLGLALAAIASFESAAAAQVAPHAEARALLSGCLAALAKVPIVAVALNTPQVPRMNRLAQTANNRCNISGRLDDLSYARRSDSALAAAYRAGSQLQLGVGDYVVYLTDAAFERNNRLELRRAIAEVSAGRSLASKALVRLR
jgi:hypothetical protein